MVSSVPPAAGTAAAPSSTANSNKGSSSSSSLSVKVEASDNAVMMSIDEGNSSGNKDEVKSVAAPFIKEKTTEMQVKASALPDGRDDSHTSERGGGGAGSEDRSVATEIATTSAVPGRRRSSSNAGDNGKDAFFGGGGKREDDASPSTQHSTTTATHTTAKKTTRRQSKTSQRGRGRSGGSQQKNQQQKQPPPPGYQGFQGPRGGPMHHHHQQQQPYNYPQHSSGPPRPTYPPYSQYNYPPQGAPDQYYHPHGSGGSQTSHPHYPSSAPGPGPGTGALRHPGQAYSSTSGPAPYHTSSPYPPPNYPQTGPQGPPPQQPHQPSWSQQLAPQQHSQHMGRPTPPYQMQQQQQQGGPPLPHAQHPQQGLPPQPSHGYPGQQQQQQPPYRGHPQHPMQPSYPQGGGSSNSRNRSSTRTGVASERETRSTAKSSKSKNSSKSRDALNTTHCSNSSTASTGSRKNKRTIDGVGRNSSSHTKPPSTAPTPSAGGGAIRRTNSTGSQGSVGLNTSTETPSLTSLAELDSSSSPQKGGPPSHQSSQRPPVIPTRQGSPSPFQSAPPSANLFADDDQLHSIRHHRRNVSTSSTASSLSVGGFSMSSYEGVRASGYGTKEDTDTHMAEASPKRRKGPQPLLPPSGSFDIGGSGGNKNTSSRLPHPYSKARRSHVRQTSNSSYSIDTAGAPARFDNLSMNDDLSKISPGSSYNRNTNKASTTTALSSHHRRNSSGASTITASSRHSTNMFVTLSTSPINHPVVDPGATPVSKNTKHGRSQNIYRERPKEEGREDVDDKRGSSSDGPQRQQQQDRESIPLDGGGSSSYFSESTSFNKPDSAEDRNDQSLTPTPLTQARSSSSLNTPMIDGGADTPTPSLNPADMMSGSDMMTDEQMLNRHLRGQSFTPLPHVSSENGGGSSCRSGGGGERDANSPTFNPGLSAIAPQLSWSIAGDTAPLGDLADWETDNERQGPPSSGDKTKSSQSPKTSSGAEHRRILSNASQMSTGTRSATISPATMSFWKETDEGSAIRRKNSTVSDTDDNILRLSALSPNSDAMTVDDDLGRNTTPLPIFFDQPTGSGNREERENMTVDNRRSGDSPQHKYHLSGSGGSRTSQQQQRNEPAMSPSRGQQPQQQPPQYGEPEHIHQMFVTNGGRGNNNGSGGNNIKLTKPQPHPSPGGPSSRSSWDGGNNRGYPQSPAHHPPRMPPTPVYSNEQQQRNDTFVRGGDGRRDGPPPPDYYPSPSSSGNMYGGGGGGMMPIHHGDRVRNLRGRAPPSSHHGPPPLLHIPPHVSSAHHLTSPMGMSGGKHGGGGSMWGQHQHHSGPPQHHHQGGPSRLHHLQSSMELTPSKRKCVPLKPPIPSKFQGDMDKAKAAQVPEFTSLVNFPVHMSQKQSLNLPDGMRCCVMCGQACPCTAAAKNKKAGKGGGSSMDGSGGNANSSEGKSASVSASVSGGLAPLSNNGQDPAVGKTSSGCSGGSGSQSSSSLLGGGYAIIPTQNKGLCTLCDVNVWVVTQTGLEIKWCKGCKNFRPWAAFGDKGLATKCVRCRERQREKYALQKEEKEKARLSAKAGKASAKAAA